MAIQFLFRELRMIGKTTSIKLNDVVIVRIDVGSFVFFQLYFKNRIIVNNLLEYSQSNKICILSMVPW